MPPTILIAVDDSAQLRRVDEAISKSLRYRSVAIGSARDAVAWVTSGREPRPDLVLFDLSFPEIDALQVIRALRASRSDLPIIVLVRFAEDRVTVLRAIQAGADDFLTKPVPLDRMRVSINNTLTLRRLMARLSQLERQLSFLPAGMPQHRDAGSDMLAMLDARGRVKTLEALEEEAIRFVLQRTDGSMSRTARKLGIGRSTLYRRIKELRLDGPILDEFPKQNEPFLDPELAE